MALSEVDDRARSVEPVGGNDQATVIAALAEQVRHLGAQAEQQRTEMSELRAEVRRLRAGMDDGTTTGKMRTRVTRQKRGSASSRRALLKWGGAAAAAATVALVASEGQVALAASANDGNNLVIGSLNTASSETNLAANASTSPPALLYVDASASTSIVATAIVGVSNGMSVDTTGVHGSCMNGAGVWGDSTNGNGVYGYSANGIGVGAQSGSSYAMQGVATGAGAFAVVGFCPNGGVELFAQSTGRILQNPRPMPGPPTGPMTTYSVGEMVRDILGELWLCTLGGAPGTWVRAAHVPNGYSGGATAYLSKPIRLLDTRGSDPNALHNGGGMISSGPPYTLQIAGVLWQSVQVPSTAVGAIGKVTVISGASGSGFVALVPSGSGTPSTGTLPYGPSQIVATSFNVGLGGSPGAIDIYVGGTAVDVVIDLFAVVA
ncbi:MAG TPA: hypothetical protein VF120_10955 [Ktedonobacterales bacterium]